jgi:translation initiation factor 2B subunit (eIF-2B alpha/beta/delta family)
LLLKSRIKEVKMVKKFLFNNVASRIKSIKIQGATNVAKAALNAYYLIPTKESKRVLLSLRPTEPMLSHVLELAEKRVPRETILAHFADSQDKINKTVFKLIKNNSKIFTHCHSTNVVRALIYSKKHGKHFEVYNTETRPLFQGRKTASELSKAGIKVTQFVDSAADIALNQVDIVFLGADALLKKSVINKVGSGMISELANNRKVPVYILADSWKYAAKNVKLEERNFREVWNPGKNKIHVENPAFEPINTKYITAIVSELGIMSYKKFLSVVKKRKD